MSEQFSQPTDTDEADEYLLPSADADFSAGQLTAARMLLPAQGDLHVFDGLSEDPTKKQILGRLVEFLPRTPTRQDFDALVGAARMLGLTEPIDWVRVFAYDPASPHRTDALMALAIVDPSARMIVQAEAKARLDAARAEAAKHPIVRGCCGEH